MSGSIVNATGHRRRHSATTYYLSPHWGGKPGNQRPMILMLVGLPRAESILAAREVLSIYPADEGQIGTMFSGPERGREND